MKKNARKELSQEKKERRCTGGGPPPPKPSDTSEWLCSIMSESIVGLPSTHDSDLIFENEETKETVTFDTSTPHAMLRKPVSKPLEPANRKRRLNFTPLETRKKIITVAQEKEFYLKKKGVREQRLLEFAEEEHLKNMQHKAELHELEIEFKKKYHELLLKKAAIEVEIEEEKLKKIKDINK